MRINSRLLGSEWQGYKMGKEKHLEIVCTYLYDEWRTVAILRKLFESEVSGSNRKRRSQKHK